jgi:hypothetical protein
MFLSYAHEGTQVCEWLNSLVWTAILLKYRTPTRDEKEMFETSRARCGASLGTGAASRSQVGTRPQTGRTARLFCAEPTSPDTLLGTEGPRSYPQIPELVDPAGPDFLVFIYGGGFPRQWTIKSKFQRRLRHPCRIAPQSFCWLPTNDKWNPVERRCCTWSTRNATSQQRSISARRGVTALAMRKDGKQSTIGRSDAVNG